MAAATVNKRCRLLRLSLFHRELVHVSRLRVVLGVKTYAGVVVAVVAVSYTHLTLPTSSYV